MLHLHTPTQCLRSLQVRLLRMHLMITSTSSELMVATCALSAGSLTRKRAISPVQTLDDSPPAFGMNDVDYPYSSRCTRLTCFCSPGAGHDPSSMVTPQVYLTSLQRRYPTFSISTHQARPRVANPTLEFKEPSLRLACIDLLIAVCCRSPRNPNGAGADVTQQSRHVIARATTTAFVQPRTLCVTQAAALQP